MTYNPYLCKHIWGPVYYGERTIRIPFGSKQEGKDSKQNAYTEKKVSCQVTECVLCGTKKYLDE